VSATIAKQTQSLLDPTLCVGMRVSTLRVGDLFIGMADVVLIVSEKPEGRTPEATRVARIINTPKGFHSFSPGLRGEKLAQ
jgi:hypothetical protein